MVGNATQQTKKDSKKAPQQPQVDTQAERRDAGEKRSSNPQTPKQTQQIDLDKAAVDAAKKAGSDSQTQPSSSTGQSNSPAKRTRYKGKGVDAQGRPRNFYNPPGKVMRHLAQQSYYDNFYGNQGQFNTLKQKYKTQLCKHFLDNNKCPLA